jgi:hypothetical protein
MVGYSGDELLHMSVELSTVAQAQRWANRGVAQIFILNMSGLALQPCLSDEEAGKTLPRRRPTIQF